MLDICTSHYETHLLQMNTIWFLHSMYVSYIHRKKKMLNAILSHIRKLHLNYFENIATVIQACGLGRGGGRKEREPERAWPECTEQRNFQTAKGMKCEANQSRSWKGPTNPSLPAPKLHCPILSLSPTLTPPHHADQDPAGFPALNDSLMHPEIYGTSTYQECWGGNEGTEYRWAWCGWQTHPWSSCKVTQLRPFLPEVLNTFLIFSALKTHTCYLKSFFGYKKYLVV